MKKRFVFETREGVFAPTDTSNLLIDACASSISAPKKILDLGCGSGVVGIALATAGLCSGPLFASDISESAVALAKKNAGSNSIEYVVRCGNLFDPWEGELFDVIIDDVAGISDDIAALSAWYPSGVICNAGRDGTKWIISVIEQSRKYLMKGGVFIFPVLSLSNESKILQMVRTTYGSYEVLMKRDWFLPDEIASHTEVVQSLVRDGSIRCENKFGKWIWTTSIYKVTNEQVEKKRTPRVLD